MDSNNATPVLARTWTKVIRITSIGIFAIAGLAPSLPGTAAAAVVAAGMLLVGLPHGALDLALVARFGLANRAHALFAYAGLVGVSIVAFRVAPTLCLLLFLGASAWHFGRADAWRLGIGSPVWALSRGVAVVAGLVLADPITVTQVLTDLQVDLILPPPLLSRRALAVLLAVHVGMSAAQRRRGGVVFESLLLCGLAWVLRPTVFFGVYFLLWHSSPHLHRVLHLLQREVPRPVLWGAGVLWTLASVAVGGGAWALLASGVAHPTTPLIVVSIAVTLPHLLVVEWGMERPRPVPALA